MRIVFFGSPPEAADAMDSLIAAGHEVVATYTQPDRKAGRGRSKTPTPVKVFSEERGVPVFTPRSLRDNSEERDRLVGFGAEAFIVVAYGRILPAEILKIPPLGVINVHPSLLPEYRGPSPVVTAILEGRAETGVTVMMLDEGMDTGPILAQSEPIPLSGLEKGAELQARLFKEGAAMLPAVLEGVGSGSIQPEPQNDAQASVTGLIDRSDGRIDWSKSAQEIDRIARAYDPWPGTFTSWNGKTLKVLDAAIGPREEIEPGRVSNSDGVLIVGCGSGSVELRRLQLEGRPAVAAADFVNGYPDFDGATLGS